MRATLTFNLPEEEVEHVMALYGGEAAGVLHDVLNLIRSELKHGSPSKETAVKLEEIRSMILEGCPVLVNKGIL